MNLLFTALIVVWAAWLILKKYKPQTVLFVAGGLLLAGSMIMNWGTILPAGKSTGMWSFDIFELIRTLFANRLSGLGLNIMAVGGFARYMDKIGASNALVALTIRPLMLLKSPYIVMSACWVLGMFLGLAINCIYKFKVTMKVLLVNGSPHVKGCTATALGEVAKALNECGIETKISWIGGKPLSGCVACDYCKSAHQCAIDSDMVNVIGAELDNYDGFIFGSPVYYAGPNGSMISFMDRLFHAFKSKLLFKPAAAIVSCRRAGSSSTFDALNKYFTIYNMPVVSSSYWNGVHGNTPEEVVQDLEGMQVMKNLGKNMAWLLKCIEAGKQAGISHPEPDPQVKTNFIR